MNFYLDNIDISKNEVHLLYWNRDLRDEDTSVLKDIKLHEFKCYQEDDVSKLSKLNSFRKYRLYALSLLKRVKFDFVIILHSLTGVLIADELKKHYTGKYIFDYRDSTYESFTPFRNIIANLVKGSYVTFVSSDAFRVFLPRSEKDKIYTSHNILLDSLSYREEKEKNGLPSDKIRIAFWGFIRNEELNRVIISKIGADNRFELHYYGREQQIALNLKNYVMQNNINNVFFHGEYKPTDRYFFVRQVDIIHNIYYDRNTLLAMGNKFYDGLIFRIPQLCMKGSFMGQRCTAHSVGFECNPYEDDFLESIWLYYKKFDKESFYLKCDVELCEILSEYQNHKKKITDLFG